MTLDDKRTIINISITSDKAIFIKAIKELIKEKNKKRKDTLKKITFSSFLFELIRSDREVVEKVNELKNKKDL